MNFIFSTYIYSFALKYTKLTSVQSYHIFTLFSSTTLILKKMFTIHLFSQNYKFVKTFWFLFNETI